MLRVIFVSNFGQTAVFACFTGPSYGAYYVVNELLPFYNYSDIQGTYHGNTITNYKQ